MSILQRYVQREFLKIFLMCFVGLLAAYFLVDFFQRIDLFLNYPSPFHYKLKYFLLKIPFIVIHIAPVAVLVAVLVTLGIMNRNHEMTAIKSGGVMLFHICYPLVAWGLIISVMVFINNEFIVPHTTRKSNFIKNVHIKKRPLRSVFRQNRIWYYGENNTIFNIRLLDPVEQTLEGITLYRFDLSHTRLIERVDARRARYQHGVWVFSQGTVRNFSPSGEITTESFHRKVIPLPEQPEDISQYRENPEEMNFLSLADYIRKLTRSGFNPTAYVVDLHSKTSIPLISFVISIMAAPFAFRSRPSGGIFASLGMSLALGFIYWILVSIGISLGHAGRIPPLLAAWAPNIFFLAVGTYLWLNMEL